MACHRVNFTITFSFINMKHDVYDVAYVVWFKTVLWTKFCCRWLELQSATTVTHYCQHSLKFSDVHIFPFLSYCSMLLCVLWWFTAGPCNLVYHIYFGIVCITCIQGLTAPWRACTSMIAYMAYAVSWWRFHPCCLYSEFWPYLFSSPSRHSLWLWNNQSRNK
jgi:hypothetical protein